MMAGIDDGEGVMATFKMIGTMILTMLNEVDLASELKVDSALRDFPLVMAPYLEWRDPLEVSDLRRRDHSLARGHG
jgi:hypothetical protein